MESSQDVVVGHGAAGHVAAFENGVCAGCVEVDGEVALAGGVAAANCSRDVDYVEHDVGC